VELEDDMAELIPIFGILASGASMVLIVWMVMDFLRRRQQARSAAEFHARLLDRITSTKDLADFLNSDGGRRFMDSLALQREDTPQQRILRSMSAGIVLTVLGIGLAMFTSEIPYHPEFALSVGFMSALALSLGIGLLLATWGTVKVSQRLKLIDTPAASNLPTQTH